LTELVLHWQMSIRRMWQNWTDFFLCWQAA